MSKAVSTPDTDGKLPPRSMRDLESRGRGADTDREEQERKAFEREKFRRRKNRTEVMSLRVKPEIRKLIMSMAEARDCDMVDIVERAVIELDRSMRGDR
jgi:hypothetical protein